MKIQQQEKESFAAYVHQFKTEVKRCKFTNDAATIRIFIRGLKNAHSLATCIYEKGPQMFADAISEAEKLNAIQQLTAIIISHSTVNVMSHKDRLLFPMPGTRTYSIEFAIILDATSVRNMVTLSWTVHTRYLLQEPQ